MEWAARWLLVAVAVWGCAAPGYGPGTAARLTGQVVLPEGARGDAYVLLYPPGRGPPSLPAVPLAATAVSDERLALGDASYVAADLAPRAYHLWSLLSSARNFNPAVDVLAQARVGDRQSGGAELKLDDREQARLDVTLDEWIPREPPAFHVEGAPPGAFTVVADDLGLLGDSAKAFAVSLGDTRALLGSAYPGLPVVYPQVFFRLAPGQRPDEVVVPVLFDPSGYLAELAAAGRASVDASALAVTAAPQAFSVSAALNLSVLPRIPSGAYELWVLQSTGQFWRVPNDLGRTVPSQAVTFAL